MSSLPSNRGIDTTAPIVVGALGGSGTRVVGEILIRSGVHLGSNLNTANDSVTATVLFNRPAWAADATPGEIDEALRTLRRFLLDSDRSLTDWSTLIRAALRPGHTEGTRRRLRYALSARREKGGGSAQRWGWKEPNSHLFLADLERVFPGLRFVYLARHPLDMAFSGNMNQLHNWGNRYGLTPTGDPTGDAVAQLDFWLSAASDIEVVGRPLLGERLLTMRFEDLLSQPRAEIKRLLSFVGIGESEVDLDELVDLPCQPATQGRHRERDLSIFSESQLTEARELWGEL